MPSLSIYLTEEHFLAVKHESEDKGISMSKILSDRAFGKLKIDPDVSSRLDQIESKLDSLILVYRIEHSESPVDCATEHFSDLECAKALEPNKKINSAIRGMVDDSKIITKGSSVEDIRKLDSKITAHRIETKKGPVKANAALENFFKPQPKAKWREAK